MDRARERTARCERSSTDRSAVAAVGEEEAAGRRGAAAAGPAPGSVSVTVQRQPGEGRVRRRRRRASGVSAGYVGWTVWPSARRISSPRPSLPVPGSESPPVATITASAASGGRRRARASIAPARARPARARSRGVRRSASRRLPRAASASSASRTSRARFEAGKTSPISALERERHAGLALEEARAARASGQESSILRSVLGEESVTKRSGASAAGSMLQRPPPLTRILRPPSRVRSSRTTSPGGRARAAKIAAIRPAAPAPTTTTGHGRRRAHGALERALVRSLRAG